MNDEQTRSRRDGSPTWILYTCYELFIQADPALCSEVKEWVSVTLGERWERFSNLMLCRFQGDLRFFPPSLAWVFDRLCSTAVVNLAQAFVGFAGFFVAGSLSCRPPLLPTAPPSTTSSTPLHHGITYSSSKDARADFLSFGRASRLPCFCCARHPIYHRTSPLERKVVATG